MSTSGTETFGTDRWRRPEVVFALAFVSANLPLFDHQSHTDGFRTLAEQLNAKFKPPSPFSTSNVKSKIENIWLQCGENADSNSDRLFQFGVHWATLPGLETKQIATFGEVSTAINELKRQNPVYQKLVARESVPRTEYAQSKLRGNRAVELSEYNCICRLNTDNGHRSVQCERCNSWQHIYCYYESDIDPHHCIECSLADPGDESSGNSACDMSQALEGLSIQPEDAEDRIRQEQLQRKVNQFSLSEGLLKAKQAAQQRQIFALRRALDMERSMSQFTTFGLLRQDDEGTRLSDGPVIHQSLERVESLIRQTIITLPVIKKMPTVGQMLARKKMSTDLDRALRGCIGGHKSNISGKKRRPLLEQCVELPNLIKSLIWSMLCGWVIYSNTFEKAEHASPFSEAIMETLAERDGHSASRHLLLAACSRLINNQSPWFESIAKHSASTLSSRCSVAIAELMQILNNDQQAAEAVTSGLWEKSPSKLEQIFAAVIDLKMRLSLTGLYFEFLLPLPGASFDPSFMELDNASAPHESVSNREVLMSTCPAVFAHTRRIEIENSPKDGFSIEGLNNHFVHRHEAGGDTKPVAAARVLVRETPMA